jgi:hypothetical protein
VHKKIQSRIGTNVSDYCASDLAQKKETMSYKDMKDRGHQKKTSRSAKHYGK